MSSPLGNIEENKEEQGNEDDVDEENVSDSGEVPENAVTSASNMAKQDVHAWRKRRSIAFLRSPFMQRRMSRGEHFSDEIFACLVVSCPLPSYCLSCHTILSFERDAFDRFQLVIS